MAFVLILAFGQCSAASAEASSKTPVPSKWGYDNFKDYMPDLRSQGSYDSCWAVSAVSMAEISLGRQGKMIRPDLSEVQLAYFFYYWQTDPLGGVPKTGDNAPLALWLAMILLGTVCLGVLALRRSR